MSEQEKTAKEIERENAEKAAKVENDSRGNKVGTRKHVGFTRGKASMLVSWEAFDDALPETLPKSIQEFADTVHPTEAEMLSYAIAGFNESQYIAASDPLAEYVNAAWPQEVQTQFRLVTRNYAKLPGVSLDDAVALIKPGFEKQFGK